MMESIPIPEIRSWTHCDHCERLVEFAAIVGIIRGVRRGSSADICRECLVDAIAALDAARAAHQSESTLHGPEDD